MKVILLTDVPNLGNEGEVISVKNGYGRNWLIPQRLAQMATPGAVRAFEDQMRQQARRRAQERNNAEEIKNQLENAVVNIEAKVGEENRIFGTITSQQVALGLAVQGFNIDRRIITINEDIKVLGEYTATIKLHAEVHAQLSVHVVPVGSLA
ncbi:MAG: 50S ribosomal protein L9 [Rhodothermaceae bacterium]|nr:50S ribosomal protein L9 [Bacteroidota bacterium]MXW13479.1 50S ribosomal protein L9 [Rhodothermaceae bacterium]MCY3595681.1 50S ribosomal protein L9 [Bacteroidota bacterium]MCY3629131.1 50S ribosomal protein L9 [Bacteroidota bacterium]MDE2645141.1 50S ribosomal protein L9 [Bacteroidota bacterium]